MPPRTRLTAFQDRCLASIEKANRGLCVPLATLTQRVTPAGKEPRAYGRCVLRALKPLAEAGVLVKGTKGHDGGWLFILTVQGSEYVRRLNIRSTRTTRIINQSLKVKHGH